MTTLTAHELLTPNVRSSFDTHLDKCPHCRDFVDTCQDSSRMTRSLCDDPKGPVPPEVPDELVRAILEARRKS